MGELELVITPIIAIWILFVMLLSIEITNKKNFEVLKTIMWSSQTYFNEAEAVSV